MEATYRKTVITDDEGEHTYGVSVSIKEIEREDEADHIIQEMTKTVLDLKGQTTLDEQG